MVVFVITGYASFALSCRRIAVYCMKTEDHCGRAAALVEAITSCHLDIMLLTHLWKVCPNAMR